ncbi:multifunctional CCA tRNA nucleotidyl transferase/2'3'-cyclic phosphodiesterase/2'nucleotidase/phosphatase [Aestuariirhabdus litorea]|uniref:CCA-adding enzyme n=1 Tax=Aestuariirhabdus litorea TaxID=2528527 RepID=A0A3P3VNY9_9GAMM|nr:multifunctional CCA tRNA nucleotidyl transferase/2'3'-cyclic phosphodiesterase/2'nucleotidase/phosphatase [Aestuariirhabdus litorea]RRJ83366.1 multifunctional CCA tRNA nucleotidyl transferase/2'3'-cyclic phosphodiesterase/2'nucleotidase/phosphatase [Aestuariirhabdus litorea]RWW93525.1 multifunctional CCA tRNA nucleotidyl transferase/2'3'-cyclic phosphodiesterase/2'nucleotidase/phosphatase [Endozoicomonadaceae bacterium GTF-13]
MKTYLVGGAVRDAMLGLGVKDRDWVVVGADARQMEAEGFKAVGRDFPVFLHPKTREEYALARTERKSGHGYTGFEFHAAPDVTLEEDLLRRDLTINAMAMDESGQLIDPYQGARDLENRCLRHVSAAFAEDPLRVLRVARFCARYHHLGFHIAEETQALMGAMVESGELAHLVPERVWQETLSALGEPDADHYFKVLSDCGALGVLMPEIEVALERLQQLPLRALRLAQEQALPSLHRFALVSLQSLAATEEDCTALQRLAERLRVPQEFRELALMFNRHLPELHQPASQAESLWQLLEQLDGLRRPQRLQQLLECARLLGELLQCSSLPTSVLGLLEQARSIDARALMQQGIQGAALGEALRQRRIELARQWIEQQPRQGASHG